MAASTEKRILLLFLCLLISYSKLQLRTSFECLTLSNLILVYSVSGSKPVHGTFQLGMLFTCNIISKSEIRIPAP